MIYGQYFFLEVSVGTVAAVLGISTCTKSFVKINKSLKTSGIRNWIAIPTGFTIWFLVLAVTRMMSTLAVQSAFWSLAGIGCFVVFRHIRQVFLQYRIQLVATVLTFALAVFPRFIRGVLPYSVSDSWTHLSYINRLTFADGNRILGSHLPLEAYGPEISLTHLAWSGVSLALGSDSLVAWTSISIIAPVAVVLSILAFVSVVKPELTRRTSTVTVLCLAILSTFGLVPLLEGVANYWVTGAVLMHIALSLSCYQALARSLSIGLATTSALSWFLMGVNHPVEVVIASIVLAIFLLSMRVPSSSIMLAYLGPLFGIAGGVWTSEFLNAKAQTALTTTGTYREYMNEPLGNQLLAAVGGFWLLLSFAISMYSLRVSRDRLMYRFGLTSLIVVVLLGPWNPLLFLLYREFMGLNLSYRVVYAIPIWLIIGCSVSSYWVMTDSSLASRVKVIVLSIGSVATILCHLAIYTGLTGRMTYVESDRQSQLIVLRDLYSHLRQLSNEVILTDVWTGAPIPAISQNYIVVHRPWTPGPDSTRWEAGRDSLRDLSNQRSVQNICKWGVSLIIVNKFNLPRTVTEKFIESPWQLPDFIPEVSPSTIGWLNKAFDYQGASGWWVDKAVCLTPGISAVTP